MTNHMQIKCKPNIANLWQTYGKPSANLLFESDKNSKYQQAQEYISELVFTLSLSCLILHSNFLQTLCKPDLGMCKHLVAMQQVCRAKCKPLYFDDSEVFRKTLWVHISFFYAHYAPYVAACKARRSHFGPVQVCTRFAWFANFAPR